MNDPNRTRDEAWEAMQRGDYELALKLYDAQAATAPGIVSHRNNQAYAALCLERYDEARNILAGVQRAYEQTRRGPHSRRTELALATWLCGDRADAVHILEVELSAIDSGATRYLDDGFGVNEGQMLYYFGAASGEPSMIDTARRYLERRDIKPLGRSWPSGLLTYLLDGASEAETLKIIRIEAVSTDARQDAQSILATKAEMKFDFCRAVKLHEREGSKAAQAFYAEIAGRPNPILAYEWYLSRAEAKSSAG